MKSTQTSRTARRQFTDIYFTEDIRSSVKKCRSELSEILLSLRDSSAVFSYGGQVVTALPVDFPRLLAEWKSRTGPDQVVRNAVVSSLFSAEEKCSGSALLAAGMWCSGNRQVSRSPFRGNNLNLSQCLDYVGGHGMARSASEAVVQLGGVGHQVQYEETRSPVTQVSAVVGKEIRGSVERLFGDRVGREFQMAGSAVVCVDGSVESLGPIHFLLESAVARPVVLVAKSFLPDVANSLAETWSRGKGKCLPFVAESWGVENFLDLESHGATCVSHERGDTFTGVKADSIIGVDITVQSERLTLLSRDSDDRNGVVVRVSQSLGGVTGLVKDRVKMMVGCARSVARSGVVKWEELREQSLALSDLYSRGLVLPSQALVAASRAAASLEEILQGIGCVLQIQQGERK